VREAHIDGDLPKSMKELLSMDESKMGPSDLRLKDFAQGLLFYQNSEKQKSEQWFVHHISKKGSLSGYAHYYMGEIYFGRGEWKTANAHFGKALDAKVPRNFVYKSRYKLGLSNFHLKRFKTARKHFRYVERKWRGSFDHPKVVFDLMKTEFARRSWAKGCYWARKMYHRYPTYPAVVNWTADLAKAEYEPGKATRCTTSFSDRSRRIRRLQWEGMADRAFTEIQKLDVDALGLDDFFKDRLLAEYNINQGFPGKALTILLKYREEQRRNFDFNMLLAKAAQRSGDYYLAQNTYRRAMKYTKSSRKKRKALFRSAFLSYQNRDYDLAAQGFESLTSRQRRSSLYRDAKWYLAWTKYLRGDFEGAISDFKYIQRKQKRSWRWRSSISVDKVKYWMSMAQKHLNLFEESYANLREISLQRSEGYYTTASRFRMQQVFQLAKESGQPIKLTEKDGRNIANVLEKSLIPDAVLPEVPAEEDQPVPRSAMSDSEEEDDPDYNENLKVVIDDEPSDFYHSLFKDDVVEGEPEHEFVTYYRDPRLASRFDRVRDLVRIGFNEAARWELYEIERRTRNETYQKSIMGVYKEIGAYNRSAYVSDIYFGGQRRKYGISGVKYLWEHAFPQPYKEQVLDSSKEFGVPPEFIFSIMRAESFFRATVESPVGAKGLMQIMPNTGRKVASLIGDDDFNVNDLLTPKVNIRLGSRYLKRLMTMFKGQLPLAAAGYNAGPHRVENWLHQFGEVEMDEFIEHIPFMETRNYVKKVARHYALYNKIYADNNVASVFLVRPVEPVLKGRSPINREHWNKL
tara:strand:+ start:179960 stop:182362 length:2403 start_codon:yes stop_codon:yes gene_type:complete